jgi:hypothetical protein
MKPLRHLGMMLGLLPHLPELESVIPPPPRRRRLELKGWFGRPRGEVLVVPSVDQSQHNTLRHDQVERRRKQRKKARGRICYS